MYEKQLNIKKLLILVSIALATILFVWFVYNPAREMVRFRYSLTGFLEQELKVLVSQYNKQQKQYEVVLEYGGDYSTSYTSTFAEPDYKKRPHMLMVAEYNTNSMYHRKGEYIPIYKLINVPNARFVPGAQSMYSFQENEGVLPALYSLPFNCSTAVLFYNKNLFAETGLPDRAPETWEEIEAVSQKLKEKGIVGFTTAWPAAYMLEHFAVVHDIPFSTQINGFEGGKPTLLIDEDPFVMQLQKIQEWFQKGYYVYSGRRSEDAESAFIRQECAMLLQGANRLAFIQGKGFDIGVGTYPYWKKLLPDGPYAMNVCGTSIWVLAGHEGYKGVQDFLNYLSNEEAQVYWHQRTNYIPPTLSAYDTTKKSGFYEKNPVAYAAVKQVIERGKIRLPNGLRLNNYAAARERIIDGIENILLKGSSVKEELTKAARDAEKIINQ
jgi:sn-glycerol 3-phosphate transport system substrate-binding protein